jgi:tRNA G18 (ribose-2'-O)-methylase SpoU
VLIVGREVEGIETVILDAADSIVEIPIVGSKESLNVSVATAIALYSLTK